MFVFGVSCQFCRYDGNRLCIHLEYNLSSYNLSKSVIFNKLNLLKSGYVCELYPNSLLLYFVYSFTLRAPCHGAIVHMW